MSPAAKEPAESKNWYKDRYQYVLVQRKLLALITVLSLVCTLAAVLVIASLTPLKSVEPFVIQVDQKSGITQTVDPLSVKELTANEAVNNFFIVQYIRSRETYSVYDLAKNYDMVRVMSDSNKVYPEFVKQADPNNPSSNAARLGTTGERTVKFKSITYLNPQLAQARLLIEEKGGTSNGVTQQHKIALVAFEYVKMSLTIDERYVNPLGFRVTDYRLDEDILQR
jgi:type IV secretion system protein VirB8